MTSRSLAAPAASIGVVMVIIGTVFEVYISVSVGGMIILAAFAYLISSQFDADDLLDARTEGGR